MMVSYSNLKDLMVRTNVYLEQAQLQRLRELATFKQTKLAVEIRAAVAAYLEKQNDRS